MQATTSRRSRKGITIKWQLSHGFLVVAFSGLPLEAVRRGQICLFGNLPAHGEPTMRMKPAPPEIGTLAVRLLVVPPLLFHVGLLRSFLNWTWNGGFPYAHWMFTFDPLLTMLVMRGGITRKDLIEFATAGSLMRTLSPVVKLVTEKSSQLAPCVHSK